MLLPMLLRVFLIMKQPSYRHRYIWLWVLARKTRPKVLRDAGTGGWQMIHTCKPIAIFSGCASTVFRWWNEKSGIGVPQRWLNFEFPSARSYLSPGLVRFIQLSSYLHGNDGWMGIRKSHTDTITYTVWLYSIVEETSSNYLIPG